MKKDNTRLSFGTVLILIAIAALSLCFIPVLIYSFHFTGPLESSSTAWGTFGDYIGGTIGPILSFSAFIAILYTVYLQNRELQNSVRELAISSEALRQQSDSFKLQNFESAYFELIRLLVDVSKNFKLSRKRYIDLDPTEHHGFEAFRMMYGSFMSYYKNSTNKDLDSDKANIKNRLANNFKRKLATSIYDLNHFYGILESLFELIYDSKQENDSKYIMILRSQLSIEQVALLFYFIFWEEKFIGSSKLRFYVNHYSFFERFDIKLLAYPKNHWELFDRESYGNSYEVFRKTINALE